MKTFKDLLSDIAEKESDAEYDKRMRKTAKTLKRSAKKGKRKKKLNVIKLLSNQYQSDFQVNQNLFLII